MNKSSKKGTQIDEMWKGYAIVCVLYVILFIESHKIIHVASQEFIFKIQIESNSKQIRTKNKFWNFNWQTMIKMLIVCDMFVCCAAVDQQLNIHC